ncbi:MAG: OsmC family peroxiredoxin [Candidatus Latescibacteria bacterium]|nr:OsmC family peroxiredoxin [Candidatus Latescibacterota bacterium]
MSDYTWTVRVQGAGDREAKVYARNHAFTVGQQASFDERDPRPSAVEYLLGALGGDLVSGFRAQAARQRVTVDAVELTLSGRLNNVLTHLGVVGEAGHPGFEAITGTLYVSADADEATLETVWRTTLERSPLVHTLTRCVALSLTLRVMV